MKMIVCLSMLGDTSNLDAIERYVQNYFRPPLVICGPYPVFFNVFFLDV